MSSLNSISFILSLAALIAFLSALQIPEKVGRGRQEVLRFCRESQLFTLVLFSYIFLCRIDVRFGVCVAVETVIVYTVGLMLAKTESMKKRKWILGAGIAAILFMLGYFKYCGFFVNSFLSLMGKHSALQIVLPIGISFYSFTAIGYMTDVYRGSCDGEKNLLYMTLFISFFPKITAGPIVRGTCFLPQIKEYPGIRLSNVRDGVQIFVFGLFKKIVLADHLGVFVDDVFFAPSAYHTLTVVWAVLSYALQIYFDFSGYSDMAIGISKMLGFEFPGNFNLPYVSRSLSEFWKRWHISLSSWLRDYLYIPLGGSRLGTRRSYVNLMLVMVLSGLWHGAGWNFIVWGICHGAGSCVSKWIVDRRTARGAEKRGSTVLSVIVTFVVVALLWVVFRAGTLKEAMCVYAALFTLHDGIIQPYTWTLFALLVLIFSTAAAWIKQKDATWIDGFYPVMDLSKVWTLTLFFIFAGLTIMLGYFGNTVFIYEQF